MDQLNFQNINIYVNDKESLIGKICLLDDDVYKKGIVLGSSPTENFYKIAVCDNNELKIIELPKVLVK